MKILYLTISASPYAIEFLDELAKKCDLTVVFELPFLKDRHDSWSHYRAENFALKYLKGLRLGSLFFAPSVKKYLKRDKYDAIIIANPSSLTGIFAICYLKYKRIEYILQSEGGIAKNGKGLKEKFKKWLMKDAVLYFSGMSIEREYFLTYGATPDRIIKYNFSSFHDDEILDNPLNWEEKEIIRKKLSLRGDKIVISVGQFIHRKGYDVLLRALKYSKSSFVLYIIGGEATAEYNRLIEKHEIDNVHFIDFMPRQDIWDYYRAADLFVLPTREDTWGLVVNEAMANGLPVITTANCVAGLELIRNGENGFIVPVEDEEALASSIDLVLSNQELKSNMARCSLDTIKEYTIENMAKTHILALREYLKLKSNK